MNRTKESKGNKYPLLRHLYHRWLEFKASRADYEIQPNIPDREPPLFRIRPGGYLIEITNHCNLNCSMCNTHLSSRKKEHMEIDVFARLLDRVSAEGVRNVGLHTVGEPFVHPDLEKILEICKQKNIVASLSTNAMFPAKIEEFYSRGLIYGLRFSIDGLGSTYENIRRGAKWETVVKSLELVRKINKGLHAYKLPLSIGCVVCKENLHQVTYDYLPFMSRYTFPHMVKFGLVNGLSPDLEFFNHTKISDDYYTPAIPCSMPFGAIYFNNKGEGTLCCRDYGNSLVIGSALDTPIQKLWHGSKAESVREAHLMGRIYCCNKCVKATPWANRMISAKIKGTYYKRNSI